MTILPEEPSTGPGTVVSRAVVYAWKSTPVTELYTMTDSGDWQTGANGLLTLRKTWAELMTVRGPVESSVTVTLVAVPPSVVNGLAAEALRRLGTELSTVMLNLINSGDPTNAVRAEGIETCISGLDRAADELDGIS